MSLLKKSLLISILIHFALLFFFSAVVVTRQVVRWVRNEPMTPTVNVQLSREMEVREQVRQQVNDVPAPAAQAELPRQVVQSPLPAVTNRLEAVGAGPVDMKQLAASQNPIAPTLTQPPAAEELMTPLLPVAPQIAPIRESTPLPAPAAAEGESGRIAGPVDQRLGRATSPVVGIGVGSLGAPPSSLAPGAGGGGGTASGTGRPFSILTGPLAPDTVASAGAILPPIIPQIAPTHANSMLPQRNFDERQKALQKYGGTTETEAAVARALAYLSRLQKPDGHWTKIMNDPEERATDAHDTALTGLAVLSFLASDHTPEKAGPYQKNVQRAVAYLMMREGRDGDLRGDGNMYDQGMATLALNEAASMSHDERLTDAAHRAAQFVLEAQNRAGGWRYSPRDLFSDTSVMGWQVMALHSAERTGFVVPDGVKQKVFGYLGGVSTGTEGMLTGYLTAIPTSTMTAEATFSRLLLGQTLTDAKTREVADYLARKRPAREELNFYYMYYGSLAMMQLQGKQWREWNKATSGLLVSMQEREGAMAGSFTTESEWGSRGGRVYTTAMATLTLEVYYRYAPMTGR